MKLVLDILKEWQFQMPFAKYEAYTKANKLEDESKGKISMRWFGQDFEVSDMPDPLDACYQNRFSQIQ